MIDTPYCTPLNCYIGIRRGRPTASDSWCQLGATAGPHRSSHSSLFFGFPWLAPLPPWILKTVHIALFVQQFKISSFQFSWVVRPITHWPSSPPELKFCPLIFYPKAFCFEASKQSFLCVIKSSGLAMKAFSEPVHWTLLIGWLFGCTQGCWLVGKDCTWGGEMHSGKYFFGLQVDQVQTLEFCMCLLQVL